MSSSATGAAPAVAAAETAAAIAAPSNGMTTKRGAAAFLGVHERTVGNLIRRGELPSLRVGSTRRIAWSDLIEFVRKKRAEASAAVMKAAAVV